MRAGVTPALCALVWCASCYESHGVDTFALPDAPDVGRARPDAGPIAPTPDVGVDPVGCKSGAAAVWAGDFTTEPTTGSNIAALTGIEEVQGLVVIDRTDSVHLDELSCLRKVESLQVMQNGALESLRGLARLEEVPGFIFIRTNPRLRDLGGLAGVRTALGMVPGWRCPQDNGCRTAALIVEQNAALASLDGLEGIREIRGGVAIRDNASLVSLAGLHNVTRIGGTLTLWSNPQLESLAGLAQVARIEGNVIITLNHALREIGGPLALRGVGGELEIRSNEALVSLAGLGALETVGALNMSNTALRDLDGLDRLRAVGRRLLIADNPQLENVEALANLRDAIGTDADLVEPGDIERQALRVERNPALRSLRGLHNVERIDGTLGVVDNAALVDLQGLNALSSVSQNLIIDANEALRTLDGLQKLERVGDSFKILSNPILADVSAIAGLTYVGTWLAVSGNAALVDPELPHVAPATTVVSP